ncbi:hypothetical protein HF272_13750 [Rhizobium leguminosarum]|uniref:hypothetical protein n=1 Tax=Rhizobium leguminosarum TaxID=384 RepID=UPI001C904774|nr:hypothetical protein [Rhizobium leguminosarum]MBY2992494.1 hypothetical protein [Rhizobium leguminosarum]
MAIDKADIINQALVGIGAGPIFSIDDDSDLAEQIAYTWQRIVDHCFGLTDWSFALVTARMRRLDAQPENGWIFAYDLPADRIGNPVAYRRGPRWADGIIRDFTLQARKFYSNEQEAWAIYKVEQDPELWEPTFRSAFITALEGALAIPVWSDEDMRDRKWQIAFGSPSLQGGGGEFGRVVAQDKAARPIGEENLLANDPLTAVRPLAGAGDAWHGRW